MTSPPALLCLLLSALLLAASAAASGGYGAGTEASNGYGGQSGTDAAKGYGGQSGAEEAKSYGGHGSEAAKGYGGGGHGGQAGSEGAKGYGSGGHGHGGQSGAAAAKGYGGGGHDEQTSSEAAKSYGGGGHGGQAGSEGAKGYGSGGHGGQSGAEAAKGYGGGGHDEQTGSEAAKGYGGGGHGWKAGSEAAKGYGGDGHGHGGQAGGEAAKGYGGGGHGGKSDEHVPAYMKPVEGLDAKYYQHSCPDMERIVQTAVKKAIAADYTLAASLIRLFFHDFAIRGTDASILIDAEGSEKYAAASKTLRGFELIEEIKKELEAKCPRTVSCADILTAAARDASTAAGVSYWGLKYGRKDGRESRGEEADRYVPMGRESVTDLVEFFQSKGLTALDLVVLSGAHTIGRATCAAVKPRLCSHKGGGGKPHSALDDRYAGFLRRKCRRGDGEYVELDGETPTEFDNRYYVNLMHGMGLLETDQALLPDSRTGRYVRTMASQPGLFKHQFAESMRRLGDVQVLTGGEGEVRLKCSAVNNPYH